MRLVSVLSTSPAPVLPPHPTTTTPSVTSYQRFNGLLNGRLLNGLLNGRIVGLPPPTTTARSSRSSPTRRGGGRRERTVTGATVIGAMAKRATVQGAVAVTVIVTVTVTVAVGVVVTVAVGVAAVAGQ